ncbi:similar to RIKEN cDNA 2510049I19 (predicted), isoform CRA_b [Rattus norvegicus]|uniref:Similar to RIKEN cDNA 2510049I19 (Predicted), isoform CRA_b n=1 Tax=Rattus norvegicus TaxID=10116 RepID=A6K9Q0_RAT|nr:similar to RIKEN cDNA 2510049I19 (predicted), isoform CRA_b [Rattus norvegicus]
MLRSFLGEGHVRMVPFPPLLRHLSSLTPQCQDRKPLWPTTEVTTVLLHLDHLHINQIVSATPSEARAGHRSPAHSLSHSPPCGLPQQMLLISVLNHGTWVSKHVACGISLVGTPGLRTPNARCDQGPVPTDVV